MNNITITNVIIYPIIIILATALMIFTSPFYHLTNSILGSNEIKCHATNTQLSFPE